MRSRIPLLVVIIALLLLGLLVFFGTLHRIRQLTANLPKVLQTELESRLERKVKVQSVKVVSSRTVLVRGLAIQDRPGFPERTFFSAPRAVIRLSTIDLVLGRASLARSISSIVLVQPRVTIVRNAEKAWNFEDLLRRPPVPPAERLHDVAYALWSLLSGEARALGEHFLEGYGALEPDELDALPLAIARASVFFICTASFTENPVRELAVQLDRQGPFIDWALSADGERTIWEMYHS